MNNSKAVVVVPVLNEERTLREVLNAVPKQILDIAIDIVVIDDGSNDKSALIAKECGATLLTHSTREGYGKSLRDGFAYAMERDYKFVLKMDGDGQHEPALVPTLVKILARGDTDYVTSSRYQRKQDAVDTPPLERRLVNTMFTGAINAITHLGLTDVFCGFFGLTTDLLKKMRLNTKEYGIELEMLIKANSLGARIVEVPHKLLYPEDSSKFLEVYGKSKNLAARLESYTEIMLGALKDVGINKID